MHHQVRAWINPPLDVQSVLDRWPEIVNGLAEPIRQRRLQIERAFETD